jgi:SnoaL-like domain
MTLDAADRLALRDLVDRYGLAIDERDISALAAMFIEDGRLTGFVSSHTAPDYDFHGRDEIRGLSERWIFPQTFHHVGNVILQPSGTGATGKVYCLAHHLVPDDRALVDRMLVVTYDDRYEREGGEWKLAARVLRRLWTEDRVVASHNLGDAVPGMA